MQGSVALQGLEIPLSQGLFALVSHEDFEYVSQFKWHASRESRNTKWYAVRRERRNGRRFKIRMHRVVCGLGTGFEDERVVNHLNDDSLDNRRENLEILADSNANMSKVSGWKKKKIEEPFL